jgi:hypothetical protein
MAKKDITAEEWVENYMKIQEEDIEFLTKPHIKEMIFKDPNDFLNELKRRTRRRNEALKIYKRLNLHDLHDVKKEIILKKLDLIIARETVLNEFVKKSLSFIRLSYRKLKRIFHNV